MHGRRRDLFRENVTTPGKTKAPHKRHFEHKAKLKIGAGISGRKNGSKVLTNLSHFSITFSLLKKTWLGQR